MTNSQDPDEADLHSSDAAASDATLVDLRRVMVHVDAANYLDADDLMQEIRRDVEALGVPTIDETHADAAALDTAMLWVEHEIVSRDADVVYGVVQATLMEQVDPYRVLPRPIVATTWRSRWELLVSRPRDFPAEVRASVRARAGEFITALRATARGDIGGQSRANAPTTDARGTMGTPRPRDEGDHSASP